MFSGCEFKSLELEEGVDTISGWAFDSVDFEEITLRQLIFMMFFTLYHGFAESGVNNCAHIVGAIIGFVCGIIIFCQMKKRKAEGM